MNRLIVLGFIAVVSCNDLILGPDSGTKIYDEHKEASPAIWKRNDEYTIKTNETDVIARIVIRDQRPDKDGEAMIVEGGLGQKNVTIQLKSPTVLRGYDFHMEVYAVPENQQEIIESETTESNVEEVTVTTVAAPEMENDTNVNDKGENATATDKSLTEDREVLTGEEKVPIITDRRAKNTDIKDSVAEYVNADSTRMAVSETNPPFKSLSLLLPKSPASYKSYDHKDTTEKSLLETKQPETVTERVEKNTKAVPHVLSEDVIKTWHKTTESPKTFTEKLDESDLKRYRDISKELGQHVVFGIKRQE